MEKNFSVVEGNFLRGDDPKKKRVLPSEHLLLGVISENGKNRTLRFLEISSS
jgi:hypothetical protein